ncbi:hypothetical protein KAR91_71630 [Candidatus Pacearchaeota archaeon]|nr:hypothetical protein [Candidatus Pacearchaeota archaeon]
MTDKLKAGCVVYMSAESGMQGYGNPQCVKSVCEPLDEISLYGHNQNYKIYDIKEIVTSPPDTSKIEAIKILDEAESLIKNGVYKFVIDKIRYARRLLK